jgi:hypothetical protein
MRRVALTDKMNEVRSEHDLENFLREMDRDKLLKETEYEELKRNLTDKLEDRDRARAYLARMAELKNEYEYRQQEMTLRHTLSSAQQGAEAELEKARLKAELEKVDLELQIRRKQEEAALNRAKLDAEIEGVKLSVEEKRRAQESFDQAEKERMRLESKREEMRQEIDYYESLSRMAPEVLVMAASTPDKARLLADLVQLKTKGGMSAEQILAMAVASGSSPQADQILKGLVSRASSIDKEEITERRVQEQKEFREQLQKTHDTFINSYKDVFEKAMKTLAEIAQAKAPGVSSYYPSYPPFAPPWSPTPPPSQPLCPWCQQSVPPNANFCPYCGKKRGG